MKLVTVDPNNDGEELSPGKTKWWYGFRLYDDNGELMRWVKSVKLHVESNQPVIMTIERYVMESDEIDVDLLEDAVRIEDVPVE